MIRLPEKTTKERLLEEIGFLDRYIHIHSDQKPTPAERDKIRDAATKMQTLTQDYVRL